MYHILLEAKTFNYLKVFQCNFNFNVGHLVSIDLLKESSPLISLSCAGRYRYSSKAEEEYTSELSVDLCNLVKAISNTCVYFYLTK